MSQNNVVKYLLDGWKLRDRGFTETDVNHVIGTLEVNAFEIAQPATSNYLQNCVIHCSNNNTKIIS